MTTAWLDTNVVVRFLTRDPAPQAARADRLLARAQSKEIALRLSNIIVAEIVWTLASRYGHGPDRIAAALSAFLRADGILADDRDGLVEALAVMVERRVSFPDAYVAVSARRAGEPVCSFDRDFERLDVEILAG
ncbi:MAG TPA: PIN domain-containing protein [Candidatus Limnocylindria bacterium]|nr:PIN domain-containing protein [Candidatus Limnocylindria bacterium]